MPFALYLFQLWFDAAFMSINEKTLLDLFSVHAFNVCSMQNISSETEDTLSPNILKLEYDISFESEPT